MKSSVLIIAAIEFLLIAIAILKLMITGVKSDAAGQGMTIGYVAIASIITLLFAAPAFAMAYNNKVLWLAMTLAVLAAIPSLVALVIAVFD